MFGDGQTLGMISRYKEKSNLVRNSSEIVRSNFKALINVDNYNSKKYTFAYLESQREPVEDLEDVALKCNFVLHLFYTGKAKDEWVFENSIGDDWDLSTWEIAKKQAEDIGHFGIEPIDRLTIRCNVFSLATIKICIEDSRVNVVAVKVYYSENKPRSYTRDFTTDYDEHDYHDYYDDYDSAYYEEYINELNDEDY